MPLKHRSKNGTHGTHSINAFDGRHVSPTSARLLKDKLSPRSDSIEVILNTLSWIAIHAPRVGDNHVYLWGYISVWRARLWFSGHRVGGTLRSRYNRGGCEVASRKRNTLIIKYSRRHRGHQEGVLCRRSDSSP